MSFAEGLVIACGLALGYWFVSNFIRGSDAGGRESDTDNADADAARERGQVDPMDRGAPRDASTPPDIPPRWYEVLDVDPHADVEQIAAAYRIKLAQYDVTRLEGLAPDLRALADVQVQRIQDAYMTAMRGRPAQFHA